MTEIRTPMRRCIGCMTSYPKDTLIRIAYHDGVLTVDEDGRAPGRGVYLCRNGECVNTAVKRKALNRAFKKNFKDDETGPVFDRVLELIMEVVNGQR